MQRLLRRVRGTGPRATGAEAVFFGALRGTGPRATGAGARFFCSAGPVSRDRFLILAILIILAILLQTRERLRSAGPFLLVAPPFYRHSGLPDLFLPHPGHPVHLGHPASDAIDSYCAWGFISPPAFFSCNTLQFLLN